MELDFTEKPTLNKPTLIAAWPGMGMLARMSADYLIQQLDENCLPRFVAQAMTSTSKMA